MEEIVRKAGLNHWDLENGYLNLYWSRGLDGPRHLTIPVVAAVAGNFEARPSVVYPYYESGREFYDGPLKLKVINTFGGPAEFPGMNPRGR